MDFHATGTLRVVCAPGLAPYLAAELEALGHLPADAQETGVELPGTLLDAMRLNLHLRTAQHVLYLLREFAAATPDDLYRAASLIAWEEIIPADGYVSVVARVDTPAIRHSGLPALKLKDAIVDRIAARRGRRPDSGPERDRAVVHLFWHGPRARILLGTTGRKLSDRGYRKMPGKAPLAETLAAGILLAAGYEGRGPLVLPMCGSGTLAIEAALIATGRAPGLLRSNYGFMHVVGFEDAEWQRLRREAHAAAHRVKVIPRIIATDIDPRMVEATQRNATTAGVQHLIDTGVCDFFETPVPPSPGLVILNPEYGERLGEMQALESTYKRIGDFFKQRCPGYTGWVFTGNLDLAKRIGLRASRRIPMHNAKIDCRLLRFELYAGTREPRDGEQT